MDPSQHVVADFEGSTFDVAVVIASHCLQVLGRMKEGDVASFVEQIRRILEGGLVSFFVEGANSRSAEFEVGGEHGLGPEDEEERCV